MVGIWAAVVWAAACGCKGSGPPRVVPQSGPSIRPPAGPCTDLQEVKLAAQRVVDDARRCKVVAASGRVGTDERSVRSR